MTQFAIAQGGVISNEKVQRHLKLCPEEGLIRNAALRIFEDPVSVFVVAPFGRPFDDAYLSAQRDVAEGAKPDGTDLFLALDDLSHHVTAMALWYGDDFSNLPSASNWGDLLSVLRRDLEEPSLETYVALLKNQGGGS